MIAEAKRHSGLQPHPSHPPSVRNFNELGIRALCNLSTHVECEGVLRLVCLRPWWAQRPPPSRAGLGTRRAAAWRCHASHPQRRSAPRSMWCRVPQMRRTFASTQEHSSAFAGDSEQSLACNCCLPTPLRMPHFTVLALNVLYEAIRGRTRCGETGSKFERRPLRGAALTPLLVS